MMQVRGFNSATHYDPVCRLHMISNRRIEADRRQRRFATLAPSAHAER